jgi:hypothetical protein
MHFIRLTQANTGVTIYINMEQVVVVAPNKTGGTVLLTTALEKESARVVPVKEAPEDVMALLEKGKGAS